MANRLCPYCSLPIADGDASVEHVFVEALGGRATISAGRRCNNEIGELIEGELQRPQTLLNLAKQLRGGGQPVAGTIGEDARPVTFDLATQELRTRRPVQREATPETTTFQVSGSPRQVEHILRQNMKFSPDQVEQLLAAAQPVDLGDAMINTTISHSIQHGNQLAAKVGLAAGTLVGGDDFITSALAGALRAVLRAEPPPTECASEILEALDRAMSSVLPAGAPTLTPNQDWSQAVFVDLGGGRSAVVVHLLGINPSINGLVLDAPLPFGGGLPVLVRDAWGGTVIWCVVDGVHQATRHHLGAVAEESPRPREDPRGIEG